MKLPNAELALVDASKIRDYPLSAEHPVGREAAGVSVWILRTGESAPRLITAYPGEAP